MANRRIEDGSKEQNRTVVVVYIDICTLTEDIIPTLCDGFDWYEVIMIAAH